MKKKSIIALKVISILFVILLILTGCTDSADDNSSKKSKKEDNEAIKAVKNKACVVRTQDTGYTMEEAIDKVMKNVKWEYDENSDREFVKVTGKEKSTDKEIEITFRYQSSNGDVAKYSVNVDGKQNASYYDYDLFEDLLDDKKSSSSNSNSTTNKKNENNALYNEASKSSKELENATKKEQDELEKYSKKADELDSLIDANKSKLDKMEKETFNAKFEMYKGNQKGIPLKSLIDSVVVSNNSNSERAVVVEFEGEKFSGKDIANIRTKISGTKQYEVSFEYDNEFITKIIIK